MTLRSHLSDADVLRQAFGHFPSGVAALAARIDGIDRVIVASSFTVGVSMDPPLVMVAIQRSSTTWPLLRRAKRIGVSVLSESQSALCRQLSNKDQGRRWLDVNIERTESGAVLIGSAAVAMECSIYAEYPAGDHTVAILEIGSLETRLYIEPLLFHNSRFRRISRFEPPSEHLYDPAIARSTRSIPARA